MFKFYNIRKIKVILAFLSFTKYLSWCGFFIFQGRAIQQAIDKSIVVKQLVYTLIFFLLTKLVVMASDILGHFFMGYFENKELEKQWKEYFPKKIFKDNENKNNLIYLMYFDYLPDLFHLECSILNNQCTIISVITIVLSLLIHTGFYYGTMALLAIFILSFISKSIFLKKLESYNKEAHDSKEKILSWINQFFRGYREIAFNWFGQSEQWINSIYFPFYQSKNKLIHTQLKRDILSQFLVEIPFIFNTSAVIIAVYCNYLSITQLFVWIGFSQFVINATHSFLENKVSRTKKETLIEKITEIKEIFKVSEDKYTTIIKGDEKAIHIKLQDNTINYLSMEPAIYPIQGKNGSGKSTLLNIIMGYERQIKTDNHQKLRHLLYNSATSNIRVIEREPEIFNMLPTFNEQILGPEESKLFSWANLLDQKMSDVLSRHLIDDLNYFFSIIEEKFYKRVNGQLSSGEKILISLLRALTSWNKKISMLVTDECIAFLDPKSRGLLLRCLDELSHVIPIFISSHELLNLKELRKDDLEITTF